MGSVPFDAVTTIGKLPGVVGVPLSTPVVGFNVNPGGKPVTEKVAAGVPLA